MSDTSTKQRSPRDDWHRPNQPGKDGACPSNRFSIDDVITAMKKQKDFFDFEEVAADFRASVVRELISLQIKREGAQEADDDLFPGVCLPRSLTMNTKHARGPWLRKEWATRDSDGAIETCGWQVVDADGHLVTACCVEGASDEEEASLDLISAAPELLEALQAVVAVADRAADEFDRARAAIAKATGASHVSQQ